MSIVELYSSFQRLPLSPKFQEKTFCFFLAILRKRSDNLDERRWFCGRGGPAVTSLPMSVPFSSREEFFLFPLPCLRNFASQHVLSAAALEANQPPLFEMCADF